jgi:hypothetical protein
MYRRNRLHVSGSFAAFASKEVTICSKSSFLGAASFKRDPTLVNITDVCRKPFCAFTGSLFVGVKVQL